MSAEKLGDLADRQDVFVEHGGRVYCWSCLVAAGIPTDDLNVTGQRLGNEPCAVCGSIGTVILETS